MRVLCILLTHPQERRWRKFSQDQLSLNYNSEYGTLSSGRTIDSKYRLTLLDNVDPNVMRAVLNSMISQSRRESSYPSFFPRLVTLLEIVGKSTLFSPTPSSLLLFRLTNSQSVSWGSVHASPSLTSSSQLFLSKLGRAFQNNNSFITFCFDNLETIT